MGEITHGRNKRRGQQPTHGAIFLDPRGRATYGIGLCARCSRKMFLDELFPDPNFPGLMVCAADIDDLDPYRLPARQTEQITLPYVRPDTDISLQIGDDQGPIVWPVDP